MDAFYFAIIDVEKGSEIAVLLGSEEFVRWLRKLRDVILSVLNEKTGINCIALPWTFDGGVFLAEVKEAAIGRKFVVACEDVLDFVRFYADLPGRQFKLRMAIGHDEVHYSPKSGSRSARPNSRQIDVAYGSKMSAMIKHERKIGQADHVTITEDVWRRLGNLELRQQYTKSARPEWKGDGGFAYERKRDANEILDKISNLRSKPIEVRSIMDHLANGKRDERKKRWGQALKHYINAYTLNPANIEAYEGVRRCKSKINSMARR